MSLPQPFALRRRGLALDSYSKPAYCLLKADRMLITPLVSRSGAASTDDAYVAICKKRNAQPKTEILMDGTAAHWIGKKGAKRIILYFHGKISVCALFEMSF